MSGLLRKRRFVWLLALVALVALSVAGFFSARRYLDASDWVTHTFEVTEAIDHVVASVQQLETGQRGFLISGDPAFLEPYEEARLALPEALRRLRELPRDNLRQERRIARLEEAIAAKLDFTEETVATKAAGKDATPLVKSGRGMRLMDRIRDLGDEMRQDEKRLLAERTKRAVGAQRETVIWSLLAVTITMGLVLFSLAMVHRDLRELRVLSEDLAVAEKMFRELAENASELVLLVDARGNINYVSASSQRLLGYDPHEFRTLEPTALLEPGDLAAVEAWLLGALQSDAPPSTMNLRYKNKRGDHRWFEVSATVLRDGAESEPSILLSARDIHERRLAQEALEQKKGELEELSVTDGLTGLLNRRGFTERAVLQLDAARAQGAGLAIVFVDLDGLKPINDQLGHEAGDRALSEAARVLRQICRGGDLVARLGGDEFAVLAHGLSDEGYVHFRERVERALQAVNSESDRPFRLGFSLGAAFFGAGSEESLDSLIKRADGVMYEEKRRRKAGRSDGQPASV